MNINKETLNLIIVSIYIYILFKYIENDDYYSMGILTLVTGAVVYKINDMNIIEGLPGEACSDDGGCGGESVVEGSERPCENVWGVKEEDEARVARPSPA